MPMKMSVIATADQKVTQLVAPGTHFIIKCGFLEYDVVRVQVRTVAESHKKF